MNNDALADNALTWIVEWQRKYDREMHALDSASMGCRNTPWVRQERKTTQGTIHNERQTAHVEETEGGQVQARDANTKL